MGDGGLFGQVSQPKPAREKAAIRFFHFKLAVGTEELFPVEDSSFSLFSMDFKGAMCRMLLLLIFVLDWGLQIYRKLFILTQK